MFPILLINTVLIYIISENQIAFIKALLLIHEITALMFSSFCVDLLGFVVPLEQFFFCILKIEQTKKSIYCESYMMKLCRNQFTAWLICL